MCSSLQEKLLSGGVDAVAPDGSNVRLLCSTERGSMAHFELMPGAVSRAVRHRTVEEIWFVISGHGVMWRKLAGEEREVSLEPGLALTIPVGTVFQFKNAGQTPLAILGITMPPWPGGDEAMEATGPWPPSD